MCRERKTDIESVFVKRHRVSMSLSVCREKERVCVER